MSPDPTHTQRAARALLRLGGPWFLAGVTLAACGYLYGLDGLLSAFSLGVSCTSLAALLYLRRRQKRHLAHLNDLLRDYDRHTERARQMHADTRELVLSIPVEQRRHVPPELLRRLTDPT